MNANSNVRFLNRGFFVDGERMPRRRLEAEVLQYIIVLLSPPFPKREEPRAQSLKRRGKRILRSLHEDGGMPEQISFYGGISILWGETEK